MIITREKIISVLSKSKKPLSVFEIRNQLVKGGVIVDRSTIYRQIWALMDFGVLANVPFGDGKQRYELVLEKCHHHLVCDKCGKVEDIILNEKEIFSQLEKRSRFKTKKHSIEFFGLCFNCQ